MSDFAAAKAALATVLERLTGVVGPAETTVTVTVYPRLPGQINVPAAVITPGTGSFITYRTSNVSHDLTLDVTLFVQRGQDRSATDLLDYFLADIGDLSVYAAVDADSTLGGVVDDARVVDARDWGVFTFGEISYLGVVFSVEVLL